MADDSEASTVAGAPAPESDPRALEAEVLRTSLKEASARLERARRERDEYRRKVDHLQTELQSKAAARAGHGPAPAAAPPGRVLLEQERYDDLRQAKRDLVRLLRRLGRPPLGWVLRRQAGYRRLRQRWLREG